MRTTVLATETASAEDERLPRRPTERQSEPEAEKRSRRSVWPSPPGIAIAADLHEVVVRELDADAEHQQDHADLGELECDFGVRGEAWRERPDHDSGEQIPDDRRETETSRDERPDQGRGQSDRDRRDEGGLVGHGRVLGGDPMVIDARARLTGRPRLDVAACDDQEHGTIGSRPGERSGPRRCGRAFDGDAELVGEDGLSFTKRGLGHKPHLVDAAGKQ